MEQTKKIETLKENHLFVKAYRKGKSFGGKTMVLYVLKNYDRTRTKLGITVSKNRGGAVVRNRTRRVIREAYRGLLPRIRKGYIIVIVAKTAAVGACLTVISGELSALSERAAVLSPRSVSEE